MIGFHPRLGVNSELLNCLEQAIGVRVAHAPRITRLVFIAFSLLTISSSRRNYADDLSTVPFLANGMCQQHRQVDTHHAQRLLPVLA